MVEALPEQNSKDGPGQEETKGKKPPKPPRKEEEEVPLELNPFASSASFKQTFEV